MSDEWSSARLDALTPGTMVELDTCDSDWLVFDGEEWWETCESHPRVWSSAALAKVDADSPGSIRVVSVPVDALLADEAVVAAGTRLHELSGDCLGAGPNGCRCTDMFDHGPSADTAIRAAIAHVIGGHHG